MGFGPVSNVLSAQSTDAVSPDAPTLNSATQDNNTTWTVEMTLPAENDPSGPAQVAAVASAVPIQGVSQLEGRSMPDLVADPAITKTYKLIPAGTMGGGMSVKTPVLSLGNFEEWVAALSDDPALAATVANG